MAGTPLKSSSGRILSCACVLAFFILPPFFTFSRAATHKPYRPLSLPRHVPSTCSQSGKDVSHPHSASYALASDAAGAPSGSRRLLLPFLSSRQGARVVWDQSASSPTAAT